MTTTQVAKMATQKQVEFAAKLGGEIATLMATDEAAEKATKVGPYVAGLTAKKASDYITHLIEVQRSLPKPTPAVGYYLLGEDTVCVALSKSGHHYAKRLIFTVTDAMDSDGESIYKPKWVYEPGLIYKLTGSKPLTLAEAAARGHLTGRCFVCGRSLETTKSVQAGIGPICAKKFA